MIALYNPYLEKIYLVFCTILIFKETLYQDPITYRQDELNSLLVIATERKQIKSNINCTSDLLFILDKVAHPTAMMGNHGFYRFDIVRSWKSFPKS